MQPKPDYAISLRQPWATLLVHGLKTIEVRRWPTTRRGRVLIHASRVPDERPEGWSHLPEQLREIAQLRGGIIGAAEIVTCFSYASLATFLEDQAKHLNEPDWFQNGLFGFTIMNPDILPFRKYPGWMRFFPVDSGPFRRQEKNQAP